MRWVWLSLVACLGGCLPALGPSTNGLPPIVDPLDDHELKEELAWAAYRDRFAAEGLLARARDAYRHEDWQDAYEATFELLDRHRDEPEARHALWILGVSAVALNENDHAERALLALLCVEAAPDPVLSGSMSSAALLTTPRCTPTPEAEADTAQAWLLFGHLERDLRRTDVAMLAFERVVQNTPAGSDAHSEARVWTMSLSIQHGDRERAFREATALIDDGGRELDVAMALDAAAGIIADDDWNGDGRKDTLTTLGRPVVTRWLAGDPPGAVPVMSHALYLLLHRNRCGDARRVRARLLRLPGGAVMAQRHDDQMRVCVGR